MPKGNQDVLFGDEKIQYYQASFIIAVAMVTLSAKN
jgi:hypothetical protein